MHFGKMASPRFQDTKRTIGLLLIVAFAYHGWRECTSGSDYASTTLGTAAIYHIKNESFAEGIVAGIKFRDQCGAELVLHVVV